MTTGGSDATSGGETNDTTGGGGSTGSGPVLPPGVSCKEGEYIQSIAEFMCGLEFSCGCDPTSFATIDECVEMVIEGYTEERNENLAAGRTYDEQCCITSLLDALARPPCMTKADLHLLGYDEPACEYCRLYPGDIAKGQPCDESNDEMCGQGLTCRAGTCIDRCDFEVGVGESCATDTDNKCEYGTFCKRNEYVCQPIPGLGGDCSDSRECLAGGYCYLLDECVPQKGTGQPCGDDIECATYQCENDVCVMGLPVQCE